MFYFVFLLSFTLIFNPTNSATFGDSIKKCNPENTEQLNSCLGRVMEVLRAHLDTGIPEINVPVLEPMFIRELTLEDNQGLVAMKTDFHNVYLYGLSGFNTRRVNANPRRRTLDIAIDLPEMYLNGSYSMDGGASGFIPIRLSGNGPFWVQLYGVTVNMIGQMEIVGQEPKERLRLVQAYLDFDVRDAELHIGNLFNGNQILGDAVNQALNENSQDLIQEMKPVILRKLDDLIFKVMNDALSAIRIRDLFKTPERSSNLRRRPQNPDREREEYIRQQRHFPREHFQTSHSRRYYVPVYRRRF